jgi:hypothetical protein
MSEDFLDEFEDVAPANVLGAIANEIIRLRTLRKKIDDLEEEVKNLKSQEAALSCDKIPAMMDEHRISQLKTDDGFTVTIKEDFYCGIPKDAEKRREAFAFLNATQGGELIKDELVIIDPDESFIEMAAQSGAQVTRELTVNTNSLKSFFKEKLGMKKGSVASMAITEIPSVFNPFLRRDTIIS